MALKKLCKCGRVINRREKYCAECTKIAEIEARERHRYYDKYIRNDKYTEFYNSPEWLKTRDYVLRKYKGLDLYALFILNQIVYADTIHHIVELRDDWDKRLTISNLFPLSASNHNRIDGMYNKDKRGTQKMLRELLERWEKEMGKG